MIHCSLPVRKEVSEGNYAFSRCIYLLQPSASLSACAAPPHSRESGGGGDAGLSGLA